MNFKHVSVLLDEVIDGLNIKEDGIYVDCTLGGGGHSLEILKRLSSKGKLIGIDQDRDALKAASERLKDFTNVEYVHDNFYNIEDILKNLNISKVDGILADLGVSSYQLDEAERGFSYMKDAPLDMRMDRDRNFTAFNVINDYDEKNLYKVIKEYGEEKFASRIASNIVRARENKKIESTFELVDIIKASIPARFRREGSHPAKRTFQAIRIEVNKELAILNKTIEDGIDRLNVDGRMAIITFHSLEDRIVKVKFNELENPCTCPKDFPICICGKKPKVKVINKKPIIATEEELLNNSRSRSAKLRIAKRV
ncbi:16S rRNA (cytosine(1402)-N(4))-methyltransferase RsmH [Haloimpatiens sp. FM7315]|uniref:16S rRNA (cytosine(1402)-N(4))-methyltransferase RsmH n=1 Tax=Haloimpatiens sp. FM7315 TaxID=3298609 RepID=UPI00370B96DB